MSNQTSEFHNRCLLAYGEALARENLPVEFFDATEEVPYDMLLVGLESESGEVRRLELGFLPGLEEDLEEVSLLQFFIPLTPRGEKADITELNGFLERLNAQLPVGAMGYLPDNNVVYYRYVLMVSNDTESAKSMVVQTTWMMAYILEQCGDRITELAGGPETDQPVE
ncbi:MAG: hypothetical protein QNK37_06280 [Acidobacteriota bacterium]|nr:hypothetical protein [Acidobacteriota bacterium]